MTTPLLLFSAWEVVAWWAYWVGLALSLCLVPVVLLSRRVPQAKVAWILALLGFPWFTAVWYAAFGSRRLERKVMRLRGGAARSLEPIDKVHVETGLVSWRRSAGGQAVRDIVESVEHVGAHPPVPGNRFDILSEGPVAFASGQEAIQGAKDHVHLTTYIFKNDPTGRGVRAALEDACRRGVEVRVLYDGLGTLETSSEFFDPVTRAGGKVASFLPFRPFAHGLRVNFRNHRKLLVVDGRVAFTGGMNIGDEYATGRNWRDLHARLEGPVVPTLQRVFAEDWLFATEELLGDERWYRRVPPAGDTDVQVVDSGPDQEDPAAEEMMFGALAAARKCVDIATPYLVPTEPMEHALVSAARRGKRVRILLGDVVDHRVVRWATDAYLPRLMGAGVEIWRHPMMLHSKAVIVDGAWATLGSTNLDMRSLRLNFELNVAFPQVEAAKRLTAWFETELAASRLVQPAELECGTMVKLARQAAYLFAPVL